jgi:serine/threonine-protein kinase HipA
MKQAEIYISDVFCGILTEDEEGFHFSYEETYLSRPEAMPISPTMPLTKEQYDKEMLFPVFDGLIPEGWLLDIASIPTSILAFFLCFSSNNFDFFAHLLFS